MISDHEMKSLLRDTAVIALVGASANPARPSHQVMAYLQAAGYDVRPVNPGLAGGQLRGAPVYGALGDIPVPVDIVDVFRRPDAIPDVLNAALGLPQRPRAIWLQLGLFLPGDAAIPADMATVEDRCLKIEHQRLLGPAG